jgi:hypothetical protein
MELTAGKCILSIVMMNSFYCFSLLFFCLKGDDAIQVEWKVIDKNLKLYANHRNFIEMVAEKLDSHW